MRKQKRWTSVQSLLVFTAGRGRVSLDSAPGKTISQQRNLNFKTSGITCQIQYDAILYFSGHEYGEKGWNCFSHSFPAFFNMPPGLLWAIGIFSYSSPLLIIG